MLDLRNPSTVAGGKGKILRLKVGYNPNSSSIGSIVYLFSTKYLLFLASFGLVTGLVFSFFRGGKDQKDVRDQRDGRDQRD